MTVRMVVVVIVMMVVTGSDGDSGCGGSDGGDDSDDGGDGNGDGSGRSAGGGIGCPLQYSWASLVAQLVKNPPAVQATWVLSLSWEDLQEKGKATHSSILAWRIPWTV